MGAPTTITPLPHGSGRIIRSQVGNSFARVVRAAHGSTGTPDSPANCATPAAARRAGPRGPSGVSTTWLPAASISNKARTPAAPPLSRPSRALEPCTISTPKRRMIAPMNNPSLCRLASTCTRAPGRRMRSHKAGINGKHACHNATTAGAPPACGARCTSPSTRQLVVRRAKAK